MYPFQTFNVFMDSLEIRFYSIISYELDYTWRINERVLNHSVLWYIQEGENSYALNNNYYHATGDGLVVIPMGSVLSSHSISAKLKLVSINFDVTIPFVHSKNWTDFFCIPEHFDYDLSQIRCSIQDMLDKVRIPAISNTLILQGHMHLLLGHVFNQLFNNNRRNPSPAQKMDPRIIKINNYLEIHPEQMPKVEDLSQLAEISVSHLRKLFYSWTGLSPLHYVQQVKLNLIKDRLIRTNDPINEIALAYGFKDANYFSRLFKKKTGFSPGTYRKKHYGI